MLLTIRPTQAVLEDKLKSVKMIKGEGVTSNLMRLSQVKDELVPSVFLSQMEIW